MRDPLIIYLRDHLAGARVAVDLLHDLRRRHKEGPLGAFAADLLDEIERDRTVLRELLETLDGGRFGGAKQWAAYVAEKISWVKLRRRAGGGLGALESLEMLLLGIRGKLALWHGLREVRGDDSRLRELDLDRLIASAESQLERVEQQRLAAVRRVLGR